ncbi:MAG: CCA tRNA nucleotidyltransferase [Planctomycetaceae bacterium]|nr:CCA tRNA nucleotidyltransferase [Planctomycetaceae bacterium]
MPDSNPLRDFAIDVVRQLTEAGFIAMWAGGCVRDFMRGRVPKDYDVATNATPQEVRKVFGRRKTLAVGESFGVIIVLGPNKATGQVEVATFRSEGEYTDGRRPDSVVFCTPEEDAARRDFTINGMFFDPLTETLHDFVGGEQDLGEGIVRAIGNPHDRMTEDKLRMLRAVRFAATMDFRLDDETAAAVKRMADEIRVVSWERITQELKRMLVDDHRERAMRLCHELALLEIILPELAPVLGEPSTINPQPSTNWWHTLHVLGNLERPSFELAMAALLLSVPSPQSQSKRQHQQQGTVRAVCRRLKLSNDETERITWLVTHLHNFDEAPSLTLSQLKRLLVHDFATDLLTLARRLALAEQRDASGLDFAVEYLADTPREVLDPPELLSGSDLQEMGLQPGPEFKQILTTVRDFQLNEQISSREEAVELVERVIGGETA